MRKIKKLTFSILGLLMFCLTLTLVSLRLSDTLKPADVKDDSLKVGSTMPEPFEIENYVGGLKIIYTASPWFEAEDSPEYIENLSELPLNADGNYELYMSFYYDSVDGIEGFQYLYDFSGLTYEKLDVSTLVSNEITAAKAAATAEKNELQAQVQAGNLDFTSYFTLVAEIDAELAAYETSLNSVNSSNFSNHYKGQNDCSFNTDNQLFMMGIADSGTQVSGTSSLICKVKLTLPGTTTDFSIPCIEWVPFDGDDNNGVTVGNPAPQSYLDILSGGLGAGEKSSSTAISSATWIGDHSGASAINLSVTGTNITGEIPAEITASNITVNLAVADNGTYAISNSAWSGSASTGYKVAVPAKGGSVSTAVTVTAQDGTTTQTYNLTLSRRSADIDLNSVSVVVTKSDGTTQTINLPQGTTYNSSTKTFTLPSNLPYNATKIQINASPAVSGQSVSIGAPSGSSASGSSITLPAVSGTALSGQKATITVTDPSGVSSQYYVSYGRDAASTDKSISSVTVASNNGLSPTYTLSGPSTSGSYITYSITDTIPYSVNNLFYKIVLTDSSTQTLTASSTPDSNGVYTYTISGTSIEITFSVKAQDGSTQLYKITGTRATASTNTSLTAVVKGATTGATYAETVSNVAGSNTSRYTYVISDTNDTGVNIDLTAASTSEIYFSTDGSSYDKWSDVKSNPYPVGTYSAHKEYYVKVVAEDNKTTHIYVLDISAPDTRSDDTKLASLVLTDNKGNVLQAYADNSFTSTQNFQNNIYNYYYSVPYTGVTSIDIVATANSSSAKGVYKNTSKAAYTTNITVSDITPGVDRCETFVVQAENETFGTVYKVYITRKSGSLLSYINNVVVSSGSTVESVGINSATASGSSFDVILPRGLTSATLEFEKAADSTTNLDDYITTGNTISVPLTLTGKKATQTITVKSEMGTNTKTYTINVYSADQGAPTISGIKVLDYAKSFDSSGNLTSKVDLSNDLGAAYFTFVSGTQNYSTIEVPYGTGKIYIDATVLQTSATLYIEPLQEFSLAEGETKNIKVYAVSEYGVLNPSASDQKSLVYTIPIKMKAASTVNTIKSLQVFQGSVAGVAANQISGDDLQFNSSSSTVKIGNFDSTTHNTITYVIELDDPDNSKLIYNGAEVSPSASDGKYYVTCPVSFGTDTYVIHGLSVQPQKGSTNTYNMTIQVDSLVAPTMPNITSVNIKGVNSGSTYVPGSDFALGTFKTYVITLDKNEQSVLVSVASDATTNGGYKISYQLVGDTTFTDTVDAPQNINTNVGTTYVKVLAYSTASDSTDVYVFELVRDKPSDDTTLSDITVNEETVSTTNPTITLPADSTTVPFEFTPTCPNANIVVKVNGKIVPVSTDPDTGKVTGSIPGLVPGSSQNINIQVYPEDTSATSDSYTLTVKVDQKTELASLVVTDNNDLTKIYAFDKTFSPTDLGTYVVNVPYDQTAVNITYTLPTGVTGLVVTGVGLVSVTNDIHKVVVSTTDGVSDPTEYKIQFKREDPKTGNQLLTVKVEAGTNEDGTAKVHEITGFDPTKNSHTVILPAGITSYKFVDITVSDGATYACDTNLSLTANANNNRTITVTPQSGVANPYTFNIISASTECEIIDIKLLNLDGTEYKNADGTVAYIHEPTIDNKSITVPNTLNQLIIQIKYSSGAILNLGGCASVSSHTGGFTANNVRLYLDNSGATNPNVVTVQAISQLYNLDNVNGAAYVSTEYEITIIREELDKDATLKLLEGSTETGGPNLITGFESTHSGDYEISDLGSKTNINIKAETKSTKAKILSVNGIAVNATTFDGSVALDGILTSSLTAKISIVVQAEDSSVQKTYTIIVSRGAIDPDDDNTVSNISLKDDKLTEYISFDSTKDEYDNITIPVGVSYYTIDASKLNGSYATIYITDESGNQLNTNASYTENITDALYGTKKIYKVYAVAQDTTVGKGTVYTIEVNIDAPNDDDDLITLKVDDVEQITPDNLIGPYNISVPFETKEVSIYAETSDAKATIKVADSKVLNIYTGKHPLPVGVTTIIVEVFAENPKISTPYVINITREEEAPKLDTLEVSGQYLRDASGNRVSFDPDLKEYYVFVPFMNNQAEIIATSSKGDVHGAGTKDLYVGAQMFTISVVAKTGLSTPYYVNITRLPESYLNSLADSIKITEIPEVETEFSPYKNVGYSYTVPNKIKDLNVIVELQFEDDNVNDAFAAEYVVYGDKNLHVGLNNVVVVVTSADGTNKTTYLFQVTREPKQYAVNNHNEDVKDYEVSQKTLEDGTPVENEYKVNIGKKKTSEVDFTKFIENLNPDKQNLDITVISDLEANPKQVVVKVSDGDTVDFVKFDVESTGNPVTGSGFDLWSMILLGVILVILTSILIAVNRDKYGKITKKTNKKTDKKEKKEENRRK